MDKNAAALAYRTNDVADASPVRSVAILYDKAIEALHSAINAIDQKEIGTRWESNRKACDILLSLSACLDHDRGGEIAENLGRLYQFMIVRLNRVDMHNDVEAARDVIGLLDPLRRSWHQLADQVEADPAILQTPEGASHGAPTTAPAKSPAKAQAGGYTPASGAQKTEGARITV